MGTRLLSGAAIGAAAFAAIGAVAAPAQAASWTYSYAGTVTSATFRMSYGDDLRGIATAYTDGSDRFVVKDTAADGYGGIVTWSGGGTSGTCKNEKGNGTSVTCNITPHQVTVTWTYCVKDGSTKLACTREQASRM